MLVIGMRPLHPSQGIEPTPMRMNGRDYFFIVLALSSECPETPNRRTAVPVPFAIIRSARRTIALISL
jgi:hypothetical protein